MDIKSILERASQVSGVDGLAEIYRTARDELLRDHAPPPVVTDPLKQKPAKTAVNQPNRQQLARYDKELRARRKKVARQRKIKRADMRMMSKLREAQLARGIEEKPVHIPAAIWISAQMIISDTTGVVIRHLAAQTLNKIALTRIHRASLGYLPDGKRKYSYEGHGEDALRARRTFATGWLLLQSSRSTRRSGKYNRLVAGFPQAALRAALRDPVTGAQPSTTTFSGIHRYRDDPERDRPGDIGYLDALKKSGLVYCRQARWKTGQPITTKGWEDFRPSEYGGTRGDWSFSIGRYWIITDRYNDPSDAVQRTILWCDHLAGLQPWDEWEDDQNMSYIPAVHEKPGEIDTETDSG